MKTSRIGTWSKLCSLILAAVLFLVACQQADVESGKGVVAKSEKPSAGLFQTRFEEPKLPAGWETKGNVSLDTSVAFEGKQSLLLARGERDVLRPVVAVGPWFKVAQGQYDVQAAIKTDLVSPDNSYNGVVELELLDENGKVNGGPTIAEQDGTHNWLHVKKQVGVPASYVSGRLKVQINKASGKFWVDALSIQPAAVSGTDPVINRVFFDTAQVGNLLYPTDSRVVKVTAWAVRPLKGGELNLSCVVRDYWGAEQAAPLVAALKETGRERKFIVYSGQIDMAKMPLEVGRYYEIHGTITKADGSPFTNWTSFAILPEAAANSYPPEQIPFTARTWDARVPVAQPLTHRLGIRIAGVWGIWSTNPPYEASIHPPVLAEVERLKMGLLTGSPAHAVEQRNEGFEKWNDEMLRANIRSFIKKYGHIKPMVINLGNEPHNKGEDVKLNVEAYKSIYQEIKRIDPSVIVVGTSIGPSEDFFKYGFGEWCDAYDFHIYGDVKEIRAAIEENYPRMFAKYGQKKPIWSTELGSNSHGLARLTVAADVVRKFSNFFAAGGERCCWFGIMYPDPEARITGSSGEAHNLFDCRYNKYHPKLDAIACYNMVNGIAAKKFVDEKDYDGTLAFLFRDKDGQTLQVLYRNKGRVDALVPLKGVGEVELVRIDGMRSKLDARGEGVTLTVNEDPILLLYKGGTEKLPVTLGKPLATIAEPAGSIVAGQDERIMVSMSTQLGANSVLTVPPQWKVERNNHTLTDDVQLDAVKVTCPVSTTAREAQMIFTLRDAAGATVGELVDRPVVTGAITMSALPVPAIGKNPAGVRLAIRNNGKESQTIPWEVSLVGEKPCIEGKYDEKLLAAKAYFAATPSGQVTLRGGEARDVFVPMAQIEPHTVYHVKAVANDASGRQIVDERPMGGFVGVPKVKRGTIAIDGELEQAWKAAPVQVIDHIDQYYLFGKGDRRLAWTGPEDLSAEIRYLWDEDHLYVLVTVKDDIAGALRADNYIWHQDGLQFLVDPTRTSKQKVGKYDYGIAKGSKGIQAWAFMSADPGITPGGEVRDMKIAIKNTKTGTGNTTYEIAFPWSRLSPFKPAVNANLGFTLIVNEDDGKGRDSFMTWFGNAHTKDIDTVGDLILLAE